MTRLTAVRRMVNTARSSPGERACDGAAAPARGTSPWIAGLFLLLGGCHSDAKVLGHAGKGPVGQIAVAGTRVYAASETTLTIYDFADPGAPRELGRLESPGYFGAMAASGNILWVEVGIMFKGLETAPESLDQQWIARGWLTIDPRSYSEGVFTGVSQLTAFDLADPARPVFLGALDLTPSDTLPSKVERMFLSGSTLYASPQYNGVRIVDVANPRQPKLLGALERGHCVALSGRRFVVADGPGVEISGTDGDQTLPGGFAVVDAADPGKLRELGRLDGLRLGEGEFGANVETVAAFNRYAYVGLSILKGLRVSYFLVVVDIASPTQPREVGRIRMRKSIQELGVVGSRLYAQAEGSILQFDLTRPEKPKVVATFRQGEILRSLFTESAIYTGTWDGVHLLRFSTPPG